MSRFDQRWRVLARSARRAPQSLPVPPPLERVQAILVRGREEAAQAPDTFVERTRGWALPAAAVLLLYVLAAPAVDQAWTNTLALENPLTLVPRAPVVPPPPVPSPPPVPRLPLRGSTEWLENLMKEMQP
jgi:hypothetical protein